MNEKFFVQYPSLVALMALNVPLFTASTANSILFLFNIRWTIRMKCYLYSQWIMKRSQCNSLGLYLFWSLKWTPLSTSSTISLCIPIYSIIFNVLWTSFENLIIRKVILLFIFPKRYFIEKGSRGTVSWRQVTRSGAAPRQQCLFYAKRRIDPSIIGSQ